MKIEDLALRAYFQKTDLLGFIWAPDSQRMAGYIKWDYPGRFFQEFMYSNECGQYCFLSEIYLWDPISNIYEKISKSNFEFKKTFVLWHPTQNKLLFDGTTAQDLRIVPTEMAGNIVNGYLDLDTEEYKRIYSASDISSWYPHEIKVINDDFEIINIDTGKKHIVANLDKEFNFGYGLRFSPQGNHLAFGGIWINSPTPDNVSLFIYFFESGSVQNISIENGHFLLWSPDGQWVVFSNRQEEDYFKDDYFAYHIHKQCMTNKLSFPDVFGEEYSAWLNEENLSIAWSPGGQTIAIQGNLAEVGQGIFFIDVESPLIQDWLSSGTCGE